MIILPKINKILECYSRAVIFLTAIFFAIIHLFFPLIIDYIIVILIIIALIPCLALHVRLFKTPLVGFETKDYIYPGLENLKEQINIDPIKKSDLNKSPTEQILMIRCEVDNQFERIIKKIDLKIDPLAKTQILDMLVNKGTITKKEKMVITDAIDLLERAAQTKDIGPISANVVITVGFKLIESLNKIN